MATYIKTMQFGPTSGGKMVTPDKLDPLINDILEKIQNEGGKILDVKVSVAPLTALNSIVSTYLIIYDASRPAG
jgi:hypothetical protein